MKVTISKFRDNFLTHKHNRVSISNEILNVDQIVRVLPIIHKCGKYGFSTASTQNSDYRVIAVAWVFVRVIFLYALCTNKKYSI